MKINDIDQAVLEVVIEAADLDIWENELTTGKVIRKATKIFGELGYSEAEIADNINDLFPLIHPDDISRLQCTLNDHLEGRTDFYHCEFRVKSKAGSWVWYANHGKLTTANGRSGGKHLVGVTYNINERRQNEEELKRLNLELAAQKAALEQLNASLHEMAMLDSLTNLPNRRLLIDRVECALAAAKRSQQQGALLFIDSDQFKAVNDLYGHQAGDYLLREIAARLCACVRKSDTVARLAGDEFVILLEDLGTTPADAAVKAHAMAQKVITELNRHYQLPSGPYLNSCSLGATLFDARHNSFDELCNQADEAMYHAKNAGRNTYRIFGFYVD